MKETWIVLSIMLVLATIARSQCKRTYSNKILIGIDVSDNRHLESFSKWRNEELNILSKYLNTINAFNHCQGTEISIIKINHLGNNRIDKIGFKPINSKMPMKQIPAKIVKPFFKSISKALMQFDTDLDNIVPYTLIYQPICSFLSQNISQLDKYTVILFTDGIENNRNYSFLRNQTSNIEAVTKSLENSCSCVFPNDLSNLNVILISYRFLETDINITKAVNLWKEIFTIRGSKFKSSSSLELEHLIGL